jgi:hypothetical protein
LGQLTNGLTAVGRSFAKPEQGRFALSNGDSSGFVFTAFQVLLVRPTEGLWDCFCDETDLSSLSIALLCIPSSCDRPWRSQVLRLRAEDRRKVLFLFVCLEVSLNHIINKEHALVGLGLVTSNIEMQRTVQFRII